MIQGVPIPKKMKSLQRDKRGYPIPFIVQRDLTGCPAFIINDSSRHLRTVLERRCAICGSKLDKELWFVGGPMSAFHEAGCYVDTAMHHECMTYALQVCPWLAAPRYLSRTDEKTIDRYKLPDAMVLQDYTQNPDRPVLFVAVMSFSQTSWFDPDIGLHKVKPVRPYKAVEFWQHGKRLSNEEGKALILNAAETAIL